MKEEYLSPYWKKRVKYYHEHSINEEFAIKVCSEALKKND